MVSGESAGPHHHSQFDDAPWTLLGLGGDSGLKGPPED